MAELPEQPNMNPQYRRWLTASFVFIALLIIVRFFLEIFRIPPSLTRYLSSSGAVFLVALYLGAVAPLHGVRKSWNLVVPGILLAAWTQAWVILFTLISGAFQVRRSHFAEPQDWGNWGHLGHHISEHLMEIVPTSVIVLVLMAATLVLWRWPITVGPGALLGALVVIRFWTEAMHLSPTVAAAWSSTVAFLLCGFYVGGVGPRLGIVSARHLLVPALVLGWAWRFWVFVAMLMSAAAPYYRTHFFNPGEGRVLSHLAGFFLGGVLLEGLIAGLVLWGISTWTLHVLRPAAPK
jgi:hypothetical protein